MRAWPDASSQGTQSWASTRLLEAHLVTICLIRRSHIRNVIDDTAFAYLASSVSVRAEIRHLWREPSSVFGTLNISILPLGQTAASLFFVFLFLFFFFEIYCIWGWGIQSHDFGQQTCWLSCWLSSFIFLLFSFFTDLLSNLGFSTFLAQHRWVGLEVWMRD